MDSERIPRGLSRGIVSEYYNAKFPALDYRWPACACRTQTGGAVGKINISYHLIIKISENGIIVNKREVL
ncbi:hypothetical protein BMS3Abin07_00189 [bacterium BMS3Abin07]|nr:hypothetical protein BMS3Abin07_00189 [bacterium BMS3Abin07]GBE33437.1 hypothetical protein BMS3Bbin05_02378 [bacterium BMS3Bbin05]HDO23534.1 hypothetical protein [Nitrospirota bacterium]